MIDHGLVVQSRDSEVNGKANPNAVQKQSLNIVVQDSRESLIKSNPDLISQFAMVMPPIKSVIITPQGIVKRVMPNRVKSRMVIDRMGIEMQAHSVDPDRFEYDT